jgi:hypothetical protein
MELCKKVTEKTYQGSTALFKEIMAAHLKSAKVRFVKNFYLIAHYTPADLSFLTDQPLWSEGVSVLAKSIITMKPITLSGYSHKLNIRDTSLLTPGLKSLKSISELYNHPLLKKLGLPKLEGAVPGISRMSLLKKMEPNLFVQYAMNDAIISLFHALKMERSYYSLCGRFEIPVTLSSLASSYLSQAIGGPRYDLPTRNGLFNVKDLPRLFTPKGVEMSGGLTEWLSYFLACYKGGRNENYVYGLTRGDVRDLDIKSAYTVALSLLQYPRYKDIRHVVEVDGSQLVGEMG